MKSPSSSSAPSPSPAPLPLIPSALCIVNNSAKMLLKLAIGVALLATVCLVDQTVADAAGKVVCYYDSKSFIREGEFDI